MEIPLAGQRILRIAALDGVVVLRTGTPVPRAHRTALTSGPALVLPVAAATELREALARVAPGP